MGGRGGSISSGRAGRSGTGVGSESVVVEPVSLSPRDARKIVRAAYAEDALDTALGHVSDKLDGYDYDGNEFDVSYQGSTKQLASELKAIFEAAGIENVKMSRNKISYDAGSATYEFVVQYDEDASTYTEKSKGYFIFVNTILSDRRRM